MKTGRRSMLHGAVFVAVLICAACVARTALAGEAFVGGASHVLLADYGTGLGAALDLELDGGLRLGDVLALGIEASFSWPLPTGQGTSSSDVVMRFGPVVWLMFGERSWWSYLKAGVGWGGHVEDGGFVQVGLLSGAVGVAIAPSTLYVHFGFELSGQVEFAGGRATRAIGLGGFLGYAF